MALDPNAQAGPEDGNSLPKKPGVIDLDAILLPKKEAPKSTERINAGALLEQEQSATLKNQPQSAAPIPPIPLAPKPTAETSAVQPLQTYKSDIEHLIKDKNVSVVTIAAAEAARRAQEGEPQETAEEAGERGSLLRKIAMFAGGVVLFGATVGIGIFIFLQLGATVSIDEEAPAPFIPVDKTTLVAVAEAQLSHTILMQELEKARQAGTLSLGLMERLFPASVSALPEGETRTALPAQRFISLLAPNVPEELARTLGAQYLLGVHMFDGPQAFLILHTDSYERAFAAMLTWENTMRTDLAPLFTRVPRPKTPEEAATPSTGTSSPQLLRTGFVDQIVENRDTRAILNTTNDLLLLWTFLDRTTIVVTTNEYTLREIISRFKAPVTPNR